MRWSAHRYIKFPWGGDVFSQDAIEGTEQTLQ